MRPSRQRLHKPAAAPPVAGKAKPSAAAPARRRPLWRILVPVAIVVALVPAGSGAGTIPPPSRTGPWPAGSSGKLPGAVSIPVGRRRSAGSSVAHRGALRRRGSSGQQLPSSFCRQGKGRDVHGPGLPSDPAGGRRDRAAQPVRNRTRRRASSADWSRAQVSVRGLPPDPDSVSFMLDRPRLDRAGGAGAAGADVGEMLFRAEHVEFHGRVVAGSPRNHPVIEAELRLTAATAPTLHPLVAEPIQAEGDAVLRGFTDTSPNPGPRASARCRRPAAALKSSICGSRAATPLSSARVAERESAWQA